MTNKDEKTNPLSERFEKLEKKKNEKKKSKKTVKFFDDPLELPILDFSDSSKKSKPMEKEKTIEPILPVQKIETEISEPFLKDNSPDVVIETIVKEESKPKPELEEIQDKNIIEEKHLNTANIAHERLSSVISEKENNDKDIASMLKKAPPTCSMTLEQIKEKKFIVKPEVKKEKKKGSFKKFIFCLIPAIVALFIILISDNVKTSVSQNGISGDFNLIILYFILFIISIGIKMLISSFQKPKLEID